jgi:hypothetical protein
LVAAGEAAAAGGVAAFLSVDEGVAEVNALDCAHAVSARRRTTVAARGRRFIMVESLLGLSQNHGIASH